MNVKKKRCNYCQKLYPEASFGVAVTTKVRIYRRRKCRDCYRLTKQTLIRRYFQWLNDYKRERGCLRCAVKDPRVLDFHHKNEENKLFTVGGFRRSVGFDRIQQEVEKCVVVCANCHRVLHDEARKISIKNGV